MSYKEHTAYKKVVEVGWPVEVTEDHVKIFFEDGSIYADFELRYDEEEKYYYIWEDGTLFAGSNDYETAVGYCFYIFITRY